MKSFVVVRTSFEGLHKYEDAPQEVSFLRNLHRHIFGVEVEIEVFHDDRELEFVMVKRKLNQFLYEGPFDSRFSCEQMATAIINFLLVEYGERAIIATVWEDNENGGRVYHD